MKKILIGILVLVLGICITFLSFDHAQGKYPNTYYRVYLNDEVLGIIKDKQTLDDYINKQSDAYKKQYNVDKIYIPNGIEIKKITTYSNDVDDVKDIYDKIAAKEPFTVEGYRFSIKREVLAEDGQTTKIETYYIYVLNPSIFDESVINLYKTFAGTENYDAYANHAQTDITSTGTIIESMYVKDDVSYKKMKIPASESIYLDSATLTKYLMFGTTEDQQKYTVKVGDNIEQVAFDNEISIEEFLISNPTFTNAKNLLFPGQEVVIGKMNSKISIAMEQYQVEDMVSKYTTTVQYDPNKIVGNDEVTQQGEDGLQRITKRVVSVNGSINSVIPLNTQELKPTINKIIVRGEKAIPNVGSTTTWTWPTNSGWTISSYYGYRAGVFVSGREFHNGIDIAGTGEGSPVYAINNGVIVEKGYKYDNGNYIIINHNNGYFSLYGHMSKFTAVKVGDVVAAGQQIGYVGHTGFASGPHLHLSVSYGGKGLWSGALLNPLTLFK